MSSGSGIPTIMTISHESRRHHACKQACSCPNGEDFSPRCRTKGNRRLKSKSTRRSDLERVRKVRLTASQPAESAHMKWVTRSNVKVDRVACPWLIRRFIDPQAEFLFVPEEQLLDTAREKEAIPFDATRFPEVKLNHRGERCSFEAILEDYKLTDPALNRLGLIVRGADVTGQEHVAR